MASLSSILRTPRRFALAGLAAALAAFAMPGIAHAQRGASTGDVWGETLRHGRTSYAAPQRSCPPVVDPRVNRGGYYETRYERVWVPATTRREWVPARHGFRYLPCGTRVRYVISHGHYRTVRVPGFYDRRAVQVWVPARRVVHRVDRYDRSRRHRVSHVGRRR